MYILFLSGLAVLTALAATVLCFIFILPESKKNKFGKIGLILHNIFNFKFLIIEKILQAFYILSTLICVFTGVFFLFGFERTWYDEVIWYGGRGLLIMILGPIVLRIVYEGLMMGLLLVKNVIQINNKLKGSDSSPFSVSAGDLLGKNNQQY